MPNWIMTMVGPSGALTETVSALQTTFGLECQNAPRDSKHGPWSVVRCPVEIDATIAQDWLGLAADRGVDMAITDADAGPYKLFLADMDSTMIQQECIDELADFAGIKAQVAAITAAAMRGELQFEQALRDRVALLAGLDQTVIDTCIEDRITLMPGAAELLAGLKANGIRCVLVSGGFTAFTQIIADRLGFDRTVANILETRDGRLTGKLVPPLRDGNSKKQILDEEATALCISAAQVAAIGDGANDIPMTKAAVMGVAHHGKPALKAATRAHINHGDLRVLLDFMAL